jgi:hypothetical protein
MATKKSYFLYLIDKKYFKTAFVVSEVQFGNFSLRKTASGIFVIGHLFVND